MASAQSTEQRVCGAYSLTLAETTSQASSLEIILDASRFGAQDTELGGRMGQFAWVKQEEAWRAMCLQPASGS